MTRLKVHFDPKFCRRSRVLAVAAMLTAAVTLAPACSSTDENAAVDTSTTSPTAETNAGSSTTSGTPEDDGTFSLPEGRVAQVTDAGLTIAERDYQDQPDGVAWPTEA